jgi:hypothetical protein
MFTPYHQTSIASKGGKLTPLTKHEIYHFDLVFKKNQTHCFHVGHLVIGVNLNVGQIMNIRLYAF